MADDPTTVTSTRTYTRVTFANPNLICDECADPVEAFRRDTYANLPCGHGAGVTSACPSWGPVDGCRCEAHPHRDNTPVSPPKQSPEQDHTP